MIRTKSAQAADYLKSHLLRFLLLAVVLTSGFSVNYVAEAKYATYLSDQSSAVADDLCFSSNYLGEEDSETQYNIGSWDGKKYELTLEIRNFENSLRFNNKSEGLYYYLTAEVYRDGEDGERVPNGAFTSTITYNGEQSGYEYEMEDGTTVQCAYLPGMKDNVFDHDGGTQSVTVKIAADNSVTDRQYLVIRAVTIPTSRVRYISGDLPAASTPGIFEVALESTFVLNMGSTSMEISYDLVQSATDYTVICKLTCGNISGGTMGVIRIYFDDTKLDPDVNLGNVQTDENGDTYVKVEMYSESIKNCYFFKKAMELNVVKETDLRIQLQEGELIESGGSGESDEGGEGDGSAEGGGSGESEGNSEGGETPDDAGNEAI